MLLRNKLMRFIHEGTPIPKQRPRFANGIVYDPQNKEKNKMKWEFANQFRKQGYLNALEGAIAAQVDIRYSIPKSWSKKHKKEAFGKYHTSKSDLDNVIKWYFDILNTIAYRHDAQISSVFAQKTYSDKPSVEINLFEIGDEMVNEHAITYKDNLTIENLDYLIKKANRLGLNHRQIVRVFQEEDEEGTHVYFSVSALKEKINGNI